MRVFEAFSGVGAQRMALRNIGANFEVVATSDIDPGEILSYYYVHHFGEKSNSKKTPTEKLEYLNNIGIINLKKLASQKQIQKLYDAVVTSKNYGDISKIDANGLPDIDIFTYSFPCQDISTVGTMKGLEKGSGTRSSLLWECKKIIECKKPKYLVLENVRNLTSGKNKKHFELWLDYLASQGYDNYWKIMDAQNYGIPQRRPRVVVASKLGKSSTNLVKDNTTKQKTIDDIIEKKEPIIEKHILKAAIKGEMKESELYFLDDRDWKMNGTMISKICSTQRAGRVGLKCAVKKNNQIYSRKLTAKECCRLMGFNDEDYEKMHKGKLSDNLIMSVCGNSIVVPVLENVFKNIIEEEQK